MKEPKDNKNVTYNEQYQSEITEGKTDLCQHIKGFTKEQFENSPIINGLKNFYEIKKEIIYDLMIKFILMMI